MKKIILGSVVVCNLLFSTVVDNGAGNSYGGGNNSIINGNFNTIDYGMEWSTILGSNNKFTGGLGYSEVIGHYNELTSLGDTTILGSYNKSPNLFKSQIKGDVNTIINPSTFNIHYLNVYGNSNVIDATHSYDFVDIFDFLDPMMLNGLDLKVSGNRNNIKNGSSSDITGNDNEIDGKNIFHNGSFGNILGENNVSIGDNVSINGNNSVAFGSGANVIGNNSVALGSGSVANEDNVISVGSVGNERKITNVANGTNDTDAVNVSQLNQTLQTSKDYADIGDLKTLTKANSYTDSKISALEESLTKEYRSATATAIALGVSPILSNGNKHSLGVGLGHYEGENAVAVNYVAEVTKNVHIQLGTALNSNSQAFKGGMSFGF